MSSNNPEHGNGPSSSKPSSKLFFSLKSYNRFLWSRSRISQSSSSVDSIPYSRTSSSSIDSIPYSRTSYSLREISSAVKNLTTPFSVKRCTLRNEKVIIFCRHTAFQKPDLSPLHLSTLTSRSHHPNLVKLLGALRSGDLEDVYMVYEDIPGATLTECLQTPSDNNPLSNWMWRMQVALDLAKGLDYIHHHCGMVHGMINSSTVIVTEPNSNACICLFGADDFRRRDNEWSTIFKEEKTSQTSDVKAFGVVILELISGRSNYSMYYLVEKAREAIRREGEPEDEEIRRERVMQFVDPRLHDSSFPMETAESLIQLALNCVEHRPGQRPGMASVAEGIQRLFLDSKVWQKETVNSPTTDFSLSSLLCSENKEGVPPEEKILHYPSL